MTKNLNNSDFHLPYNLKLVERAKELRKNMTPVENIFCVSPVSKRIRKQHLQKFASSR